MPQTVLSHKDMIDALRHADQEGIEQTTGSLVNTECPIPAYCAFGILGKAAGFSDKELDDFDDDIYRLIREAYDIDRQCMDSIITANDKLNYSFREIADKIEIGEIC